MTKTNLVLTVCIVRLFTGAMIASAQNQPPQTSTNTRPPRDTTQTVASALDEIRKKFDVPGIAAAIATSKGIECLDAVGVRKTGTTVLVTTNDLWHLGSNTKAMTATLVARFVERGVLDWDSTVASLFPELESGFSPEARRITVMHLLTHHSGLPDNLDWSAFRSYPDAPTARLEALKKALAKPLLHPPGKKHLYSNLGYVVLGAIIEKLTNKSWETVIRDDLFMPLGMHRTGFGGTGTQGQLDQPWGHYSSGKPVAQNGPQTDNPPVLGPAGRVHAPLDDWARFVVDQLRGARGEQALLKSTSYAVLHNPPFDSTHAAGWIVVERDWGGGKVLNHTGCNTMNYANVWLAPNRDFAIMVCVNQGDNAAFKATDEAVQALIRIHAARMNRD